VSRQEIAGTLWGECDEHRARRSLSTALWRLKATPGLDRDLVRSAGPGEIGLICSRTLWVDVAAFEVRARPWQGTAPEKLSQRARHSLARAVSIYGGDFLPQADSEWVLLERQRLRALYLDSLYQLTAAYAYGQDHVRCITYGRRLAALEPLREDVHRILMRAYVSSGNRAKAIEQYRTCQTELARELGVVPMAETQALFDEISQPDAENTATAVARVAAGWNAAAEHVNWVRRALRQSEERLAEALAAISQASKSTSAS
jgi:DNA-binding SARP family transcriptional activator